MGAGRRRRLLLGALLVCLGILGLSPPPVQAQEERGISLERIELLLNARQTSQAILQLIRTNEFCLSFAMDEDAIQRLRGAGADDALLEGLGDVPICQAVEEAREEEPAPREEEETRPTPSSLQFSPASAALRSLAVPGLGQFYTGNQIAGGVFLAGWAGALGFGLMSEEVTIYCLAPVSGSESCPSGQIRDQVSERPNLMIGVGVAAAVAVASALHARSAANKANTEGSGLREDDGAPRMALYLLPVEQPVRATEVVLFQLRF